MRLDDLATSPLPTDSQPISPDTFRNAFRRHPSGVGVISADDGTGPVSMTASSIFTISSDPPLVGFSASAASSSSATLLRAETLVIHLVSPTELWLAKLAATPGIDRFAGVHWDRLRSGEPYYPEIRTWLRGRTTSTVDVGDATIVVVEILELKAGPGDDPGALVYFDRSWHSLGAGTHLD